MSDTAGGVEDRVMEAPSQESMMSEKRDWVVFPWENAINIHSDREEYNKRRDLR